MRHLPTTTVALALALAVPLASAPASADPPAAAREADRALIAAERARRHLLTLLDESRRARRIRDVACVDGALSQVNSFGRTLEDRRARLAGAARRGDAAELRLQRRVIRALARQLEERTRAGRACVYGELPAGREATVVTVIVDPAVPHREDLAPVASADPPRRR